jgi:hypothetical protein
MHGIKPRTLTNAELLKYGAELAAEGPLPVDWAIELLRRLNYYTSGLEKHTASNVDERQLTLPL